jgi:hypothetical protein
MLEIGAKMKAIDGALPMNTRYKIIDISYGKLENQASSCENCGKLISNIATIEDESNNKRYNVGCDCAEALFTRCSFGALMDLKQKQKEHNKKLSLIRKIKKHQKDENLDVKIEDGTLTFFEQRTPNWGDNRTPYWHWKSKYNLGYAKRVIAELGSDVKI